MNNNQKKPAVTITVGAFYYAMNRPEDGVDFDITKYGDIVKSPVIKKVTMKENADTGKVKASGADYCAVPTKSSEEIGVEVVAIHPDDLVEMRGDNISEKGLITDNTEPKRPFFAIGFPEIKSNGNYRYTWYPKCQLDENSGDLETKEDSFKEQNKNLTITAYPFDGKSTKVIIDSESTKCPKGLTEEKFFTKIITCDADLTSVLTPEASENSEVQGA